MTEVNMDWQAIAIVLLAAWAIFHTYVETQQDKKIKDLERKITRSDD